MEMKFKEEDEGIHPKAEGCVCSVEETLVTLFICFARSPQRVKPARFPAAEKFCNKVPLRSLSKPLRGVGWHDTLRNSHAKSPL